MPDLNQTIVGAGQPVLILHGGKLDHRHMRDALEPVFEDCPGWRRHYVDLPGCGGSTGFDHVATQDDVLAEVARVLADLSADGPVAVIGESRGSYIARGLAHRFPGHVSGVALIVPGGESPKASARLPEPNPILPDPTLLAGLEPALRSRADHLVVQTPRIIDKIRETKLPAAALHDAGLEARLQRNFALSFHDALSTSRFDKPALIVSGRQDSIAGFEDAQTLAACYPRATFALLDCAGHSLGWERPGLFKALLRDWLQRLANA